MTEFKEVCVKYDKSTYVVFLGTYYLAIYESFHLTYN